MTNINTFYRDFVADLEFTNTDLSTGILTVSGIKTIAHVVDNSGKVIPITDEITYLTSTTTINLTSFGTLTGTWKVKFAQGVGSDSTINTYNYTNYGNFYPAVAFPQDWKESVWTNPASYRPIIDYDQIFCPVWRVDYNIKEGLGLFIIDRIPTGATNLVVEITAIPLSTAASGTDMAWSMDYTRYRTGAAQTNIATVTALGNTALGSTGVTMASYTVALSTLSAQAADQLAIVLYPNTAASNRKQTDWMILSVGFKVS